MSIPNITEVGRVPSSTSQRTAIAIAASPARPGGAGATRSTVASADQPESLQPSPPRFPWLSRLSQQLESAAKQKPAFPSAPVLGDHIDKSA